ncbi:hypothetical protein ACJIZ3_018867 [Penstemon smallii]|uniref:RRP12-like protein n=1 Tax=Penstemon smallii TaxID=265156 RepID=A0ABD3T0G4_9LAMI
MDIDMATPLNDPNDDDFGSSVLSKFENSTNEHHRNICAAIGAIKQALIDQNLPLKPVAYFGATCSSLSSSTPAHLDALLTIIALVIDKFPPAVLTNKYAHLSELLIRILRLNNTVGVDGIVSGLKFASRLLTVREKAEWDDVSQLYDVLINYMTDDRSKVRKQSQSCLRQVLEYFQMMPKLKLLLAPASEAITNVFERLLLLAGGSNANASEGPKGAQEVLYVLDTLKVCLPYMSSKSSTNILKRFKSLLEVRHPVVTKRIIDSLSALCLHSTREVSSDVLLDLLCSLADSISWNESGADSMTFTARLLDTGMKKVYSLDRQICVVKLPVVFVALNGVLASEHEEALVAAVATYKSLIGSCIDESLIKLCVDKITVHPIVNTRKSSPTIIEKVCTTIESLLDDRYEAVWDMSFQIVSTIFEKLGKYSFHFLEKTLNTLANMQKFRDEDFSFRKQLHECVGAAIGSMGPENFLSLLHLNLEAPDESEANIWLFPILKKYTVGAHLKFFTDSILPMIGDMKRKYAMLEQEGKLYAATRVNGIVYALWSLLPSFCNYPDDTAENFKSLEKALCTALQEDPDFRGIICSSVQILIRQNKRILEGKENDTNMKSNISEERAIAFYTSHVAGANLSVLKSSSPKELLGVLKEVYLKSSKDICGVLQNTIGELSSISDKEVVRVLFLRTMKKLHKVTEEAGESGMLKTSNSMQVDNLSNEDSPSIKRAQLLDLAASFLPGLGSDEINILFRAIQPALEDADGLIQKKAYRVLSSIFQFSDDFISKKIEEVCVLMIKVQPSCHFSAKRHRLDCLYFLFIHVSKEVSEQGRHEISKSFLTEIILSLKEANKKTRNRAYDVLVQIGHAYSDEEKGGKKEKLKEFFVKWVGGKLRGETPHMVSAAMTGLARLAYEFSDLLSASYDILPSTLLLLGSENKEKIKASLGFLKVLVAKSHAEDLQKHLPNVVEGQTQTHLQKMVEDLLKHDSTRSFKAKVKLLLEMLVKKCGLDAVKQAMPERHMKLLTNIRKLKERKEKKQAASSVETKSIQSKATTSRMSRWNHTKIFSDFDDEMRNSDGEFSDQKSGSTRQSKHSAAIRPKAPLLRTKRTRNEAKSLQEDAFDNLNDEPLDLLDHQKRRTALRSTELRKSKSDSDEEPDIDSEGRLIIREDGKYKKTDRKSKQEMPSDNNLDVRSKAGSQTSSRNDKKRRKTSETGWAYTGKEYASKKAGGDVKRKDKLEPYAYWPLDRKMVSRRPEHRAAARKGMASVVKLTKNLEGKSVSSALSMKGVMLKRAKKR